MARFGSWWTSPEMATPQGIAQAARDAGVFLETGDYKVDTLDFGDGEPLADVLAQGTVISANGTNWLVYPAASRDEGWRAQKVTHRSGKTEIISRPRQIGTAYDQAARIVEALIAGASSQFAAVQNGNALIGVDYVSLPGLK